MTKPISITWVSTSEAAMVIERRSVAGPSRRERMRTKRPFGGYRRDQSPLADGVAPNNDASLGSADDSMWAERPLSLT
jgi:hypothetical protein